MKYNDILELEIPVDAILSAFFVAYADDVVAIIKVQLEPNQVMRRASG